jgi:hypothetical protein
MSVAFRLCLIVDPGPAKTWTTNPRKGDVEDGKEARTGHRKTAHHSLGAILPFRISRKPAGCRPHYHCRLACPLSNPSPYRNLLLDFESGNHCTPILPTPTWFLLVLIEPPPTPQPARPAKTVRQIVREFLAFEAVGIVALTGHWGGLLSGVNGPR